MVGCTADSNVTNICDSNVTNVISKASPNYFMLGVLLFHLTEVDKKALMKITKLGGSLHRTQKSYYSS